MLFWKWGCLVGLDNSIFRKLKSVDLKKQPLTTEMLLHFYFPFKAFPENERERERARASAREEKIQSGIASSCSSPRSRAPAPVRDRDRADLGAISWRRDRDRTVDRDHGAVVVDDFVFSGLWLVFSNLCFPSSFPNTRKYFPENFLKCNQTHGNIDRKSVV